MCKQEELLNDLNKILKSPIVSKVLLIVIIALSLAYLLSLIVILIPELRNTLMPYIIIIFGVIVFLLLSISSDLIDLISIYVKLKQAGYNFNNYGIDKIPAYRPFEDTSSFKELFSNKKKREYKNIQSFIKQSYRLFIILGIFAGKSLAINTLILDMDIKNIALTASLTLFLVIAALIFMESGKIKKEQISHYNLFSYSLINIFRYSFLILVVIIAYYLLSQSHLDSNMIIYSYFIVVSVSLIPLISDFLLKLIIDKFLNLKKIMLFLGLLLIQTYFLLSIIAAIVYIFNIKLLHKDWFYSYIDIFNNHLFGLFLVTTGFLILLLVWGNTYKMKYSKKNFSDKFKFFYKNKRVVLSTIIIISAIIIFVSISNNMVNKIPSNEEQENKMDPIIGSWTFYYNNNTIHYDFDKSYDFYGKTNENTTVNGKWEKINNTHYKIVSYIPNSILNDTRTEIIMLSNNADYLCLDDNPMILFISETENIYKMYRINELE